MYDAAGLLWHGAGSSVVGARMECRQEDKLDKYVRTCDLEVSYTLWSSLVYIDDMPTLRDIVREIQTRSRSR